MLRFGILSGIGEAHGAYIDIVGKERTNATGIHRSATLLEESVKIHISTNQTDEVNLKKLEFYKHFVSDKCIPLMK